jgi:beta-galactosidase/beta-glucuronidase
VFASMLQMPALKALQNGQVLETKSLKIAFRRARVVQDKLIDQEGLTFLFEINNIRIFCGGLSPVKPLLDPEC